MRRALAISFAMLMAIAVSARSAEPEGRIRASSEHVVEIPLEVRQVSTGPRLDGTQGLRLSIVVEEVYCNLNVELILYGEVEGQRDRVARSFFLAGFDVADRVGLSSLTRCQIGNWRQWNEVELEVSGTKIILQYRGDNEFEVRSLDPAG